MNKGLHLYVAKVATLACLAQSPSHSQILSCSCGEKLGWRKISNSSDSCRDKMWGWPGDKAGQCQRALTKLNQCLHPAICFRTTQQISFWGDLIGCDTTCIRSLGKIFRGDRISQEIYCHILKLQDKLSCLGNLLELVKWNRCKEWYHINCIYLFKEDFELQRPLFVWCW